MTATRVLVALVALASPGWFGPGGPAVAGAPGCAVPSGVYRDATPWPQRLFAPDRIQPLTDGSGVTVAVLGTGVDGGNRQFGPGQVLAGMDVTGSGRPADRDCDGRGTLAAGIIGARPDGGTTFAGLAPGVRILPIRYTEATDRGDTVDPDRLATAIRAATGAGADIICIVVPATVDSPALGRAVAEARAADLVVVSPATGERPESISYPTAAAGVLAVGAVAEDGSAASVEAGDHVDVAAPGKGLVSLATGASGRLGHVGPVDAGIPYAAAFVAAAAALVRGYRSGLSAADVVARIERTAVGRGLDARLGLGVVNPYAAVTAEGIDGPRPGPTAQQVIAPVPAPTRRARDSIAAWTAAAGLGFAAMLLVAAAAVRRGRAGPGGGRVVRG